MWIQPWGQILQWIVYSCITKVSASKANVYQQQNCGVTNSQQDALAIYVSVAVVVLSSVLQSAAI